MTTGMSAVISRQRGFWLRCFLDRAFLFTVVSLGAFGMLWAKVAPLGPLHLWRLHGYFMNPTGKPIENVEVTLQRDGAVQYTTKTDASGRFAFDHIYGRYSLHIEKSNDYSQLSREVIVGEAATVLRSNTLYVIAGPGACTDDCSSVFTSKGDFEKAVRRNTEHSR
jgi:Carboxypeptidase regulatory-like domain